MSVAAAAWARFGWGSGGRRWTGTALAPGLSGRIDALLRGELVADNALYAAYDVGTKGYWGASISAEKNLLKDELNQSTTALTDYDLAYANADLSLTSNDEDAIQVWRNGLATGDQAFEDAEAVGQRDLDVALATIDKQQRLSAAQLEATWLTAAGPVVADAEADRLDALPSLRIGR